jgi:peptide alpha-N-acetyltransferase
MQRPRNDRLLIQPADYDFEQSELLLYQNMILRESGQLQLALEKLEENSAHIVDRLSYMEIRGGMKTRALTMPIIGDLLIQLGKWDAAEKVYWQLIDRNPENLDYYNRLERCRARGLCESLLFIALALMQCR